MEALLNCHSDLPFSVQVRRRPRQSLKQKAGGRVTSYAVATQSQSIEVQPLPVPNFVLAGERGHTKLLPVGDVCDDDLNRLADDYRDRLLARARQQRAGE